MVLILFYTYDKCVPNAWCHGMSCHRWIYMTKTSLGPKMHFESQDLDEHPIVWTIVHFTQLNTYSSIVSTLFLKVPQIEL